MQTELILRLDKDLLEKIQLYSGKIGKTVSQIVADYFAAIDNSDFTPLVRSLKGSLRNANISEDDYRKHLEGRYL